VQRNKISSHSDKLERICAKFDRLLHSQRTATATMTFPAKKTAWNHRGKERGHARLERITRRDVALRPKVGKSIRPEDLPSAVQACDGRGGSYRSAKARGGNYWTGASAPSVAGAAASSENAGRAVGSISFNALGLEA
jgi:hypothetical protein